MPPGPGLEEAIMRSSASSWRAILLLFLRRHQKKPMPAIKAAPPTPTTTPMTVFRCDVDRPDDPLSLPPVALASVAVPVVVATEVMDWTSPCASVVTITLVKVDVKVVLLVDSDEVVVDPAPWSPLVVEAPVLVGCDPVVGEDPVVGGLEEEEPAGLVVVDADVEGELFDSLVVVVVEVDEDGWSVVEVVELDVDESEPESVDEVDEDESVFVMSLTTESAAESAAESALGRMSLTRAP